MDVDKEIENLFNRFRYGYNPLEKEFRQEITKLVLKTALSAIHDRRLVQSLEQSLERKEKKRKGKE